MKQSTKTIQTSFRKYLSRKQRKEEEEKQTTRALFLLQQEEEKSDKNWLQYKYKKIFVV